MFWKAKREQQEKDESLKAIERWGRMEESKEKKEKGILQKGYWEIRRECRREGVFSGWFDDN